jgi:hypothetical protein
VALTVKAGLRVWFILALVVMTALTSWASAGSNVLEGLRQVWSTRWGLATFGDAYFAFAVFYFWVAYLHRSWAARLFWLLAIVGLGNLAIGGFALWRVSRWDETTGAAGLLLHP